MLTEKQQDTNSVIIRIYAHAQVFPGNAVKCGDRGPSISHQYLPWIILIDGVVQSSFGEGRKRQHQNYHAQALER